VGGKTPPAKIVYLLSKEVTNVVKHTCKWVGYIHKIKAEATSIKK
jgi:hypothetical protein